MSSEKPRPALAVRLYKGASYNSLPRGVKEQKKMAYIDLKVIFLSQLKIVLGWPIFYAMPNTQNNLLN